MPRNRTPAGCLVEACQASSRPIYLLDEDRRILFCNRACAAWAGASAAELIGQVCQYRSPAGDRSPAAIAARLCPPPAAFEATGASGRVSAVLRDGRLVFRSAVFLPLAENAVSTALLVICAEQDLNGAEIAGPEAVQDAAAVGLAPADAHGLTQPTWHEQLTQMRHAFADRYAVEQLLGNSPFAIRLRAQVQLAGASAAHVLIAGPAGSGKEQVAKAIHYRQPHEKAPRLVPIDCAALDAETLVATVESLCARLAAGRSDAPATLLLRAADHLPLAAQPVLLRWLKAARVRVLSTAERPLEELVLQGQWSADLALLLATMTIEMVPLSRRLADLPLLAQSFVEEINATGGRQVAGFSRDALEQLAGYPWPGQIDELAEIVRQSHAQAAGVQITARDLPARIRLAADAAQWPRRQVEPIDLASVLESVETELIQRALDRAKGNKSRAAELLGLTRPKLYRRLLQLGLEQGEAPAAEDEVQFEETE